MTNNPAANPAMAIGTIPTDNPTPARALQQTGIDEQHHLDAIATVQQQAAEQRAKSTADVEQHLHQSGLGFAEALLQQQRWQPVEQHVHHRQGEEITQPQRQGGAAATFTEQRLGGGAAR